MVSENQQVVLNFLEAVKSRNTEEIVSFFTSDAVFHNIPWKPIEGKGAIRGFVQNMVDASTELNWQVHNIAETDTGAVMTERTDRFRFGEQPMEVPVMGIFEIKDGKISAWRDYFDSRQVAEQMP